MHNITTIVVFIFLCHSLQFSDVEFGAKAPLQKKNKKNQKTVPPTSLSILAISHFQSLRASLLLSPESQC